MGRERDWGSEGEGGGYLSRQDRDVDGLGGIDFDHGTDSKGLGVFGELVERDVTQHVGGMVAVGARAKGEAAGGFLKGDPAMYFDDLGGEGQKLCSLRGVLGAEIGFEDDLGTMGSQRPEEIDGGVTHATGIRKAIWTALERDEEGFLNVVFGEESEAERLGERAGDGGFAGSWGAGDKNEAVGGSSHLFHYSPGEGREGERDGTRGWRM